MKRSQLSPLVRNLTLGVLAVASPLAVARAQERVPVAPGGAVNITVAPAGPTAPPVSITLGDRHGHVTPIRGKCAHTGGGLIDVASPSADTVVITMTAAVVANATMTFDLDQAFEVSFDDPKLKRAKLAVEARVIGVLRGERKGCAELSDACASVVCGPAELVGVCLPVHSVCRCEHLGVNDHVGPREVPVVPGKYAFHQTFAISAHTDSFVCKRPSAEFAPDPALDPLWISYFEPFHGVKKDTFGFQVTMKVIPDTGNANEKKPEAVAAPK
jgi:hypothetical protein